MNIKSIVKRQYIENVNEVRHQLANLQNPAEGWIKTMRKALGMSGAQLARRLNVSRATVSQSEKAELSGSITVKKLEEIAKAMNCRMVYSFVPETDVGDVIRQRAYQKVAKRYNTASIHMALESQQLSSKKREADIDKMVEKLIESSNDLWND